MPAPLTTEQANAVYDILVKYCGAVDDPGRRGSPTTCRDDFVLRQTDAVVNEYRFLGGLGFGGKFWRMTGLRRGDRDMKWSVTAYREDTTPARQQMIDAANRALAELREKETA